MTACYVRHCGGGVPSTFSGTLAAWVLQNRSANQGERCTARGASAAVTPTPTRTLTLSLTPLIHKRCSGGPRTQEPRTAAASSPRPPSWSSRRGSSCRNHGDSVPRLLPAAACTRECEAELSVLLAHFNASRYFSFAGLLLNQVNKTNECFYELALETFETFHFKAVRVPHARASTSVQGV